MRSAPPRQVAIAAPPTWVPLRLRHAVHSAPVLLTELSAGFHDSAPPQCGAETWIPAPSPGSVPAFVDSRLSRQFVNVSDS